MPPASTKVTQHRTCPDVGVGVVPLPSFVFADVLLDILSFGQVVVRRVRVRVGVGSSIGRVETTRGDKEWVDWCRRTALCKPATMWVDMCNAVCAERLQRHAGVGSTDTRE